MPDHTDLHTMSDFEQRLEEYRGRLDWVKEYL